MDVRQQAEEWIDVNGLPTVHLVESAIRSTDLRGDPLGENPFRVALVEAALDRGAQRYRTYSNDAHLWNV